MWRQKISAHKSHFSKQTYLLPVLCLLLGSLQWPQSRVETHKETNQDNSTRKKLFASFTVDCLHSKCQIKGQKDLKGVCVCVCTRGRTVMLLSITSDNSRLPEASAANIIKSLFFINVTQSTPKKNRRPHVFVAKRLGTVQSLCPQMFTCATVRSPNCVRVDSRFNIPNPSAQLHQ